MGERLRPWVGGESGPPHVPASEAGMRWDALVMLPEGIWYPAADGLSVQTSCGVLYCVALDGHAEGTCPASVARGPL